MNVNYLQKALDELHELPLAVQDKFDLLITAMERNEKLPVSSFKKLQDNLYELRVKHYSNIYRGLGGYIKPDYFIVRFFQKKSQKTPLKEIKTASKRLKSLN